MKADYDSKANALSIDLIDANTGREARVSARA